MAKFVGREKWIQRFQDYLSQDEGVLWKLTGQPGIGKSSLLNHFTEICQAEERPNTLLDLESYVPTHGLEVLTTLAESATFFDTENSNKSLKEKVGEGFLAGGKGITDALDVGKDFIPGGALLAGGAKALVGLGSGIAGKAALISETQAEAQPELYLLNALSAAASNNEDPMKAPVCIVDTYEHILDKQLKIKTRLSFSRTGVRSIQEKEVQFSEWLNALLTYFSKQDWRVVVAGRAIPRSNNRDMLQRFTREEMIEAVQDRPALRDYLGSQEEAMLVVLATLSFEGNPLWLQVAMNLLETLLAEGRDLELLADDPEELQSCFEEEDPFGIDEFDGAEHSSCKLSLINTMTTHIKGLEDQAWKIAIPRMLDKGIVQQLFTKEQAAALLHNFKIAGVFRESGQQFTLHEEIRDLLLFYARRKGWLESEETREIHGRLWDYLNDFYLGKLPVELQAVMTRDGLMAVFNEQDRKAAEERLTKQLTEHFSLNWMLEACYHRVMSIESLSDKNTSPIQFWSALGGSAILIPIYKWQTAEKLTELTEKQIQGFEIFFSEEFESRQKLYGDEVATAVYQAQLSGNTDVLSDIAFWELRVTKFGLSGDYAGYIDAIYDYHPDLYLRKGINLTDKLLTLYGESDNSSIQEQCAKALFYKGVTLGEKLNDPEAAVASYDELIQHFADSDNPAIQERCANALFYKVVTLGNKLNEPEAAIASIVELIQRFVGSDNPAIQKQCLSALFYKELALGEQLNDPEIEAASYDELIQRCADSDDPAIKEQYVKALLKKGATLSSITLKQQ